MKELSIPTHKRVEMIDITREIAEAVKKDTLKNGMVVIYVPHTTAGITINEGADPDVQRDILEKLRSLVPEHDDYHHGEGNSDAHIKASLLGSSVTVLVDQEKLVLGTWQHIFFVEGDGPRTRTIYVQTFSR
jgi:secondary thiamine-phosphate synthase enzyme